MFMFMFENIDWGCCAWGYYWWLCGAVCMKLKQLFCSDTGYWTGTATGWVVFMKSKKLLLVED